MTSDTIMLLEMIANNAKDAQRCHGRPGDRQALLDCLEEIKSDAEKAIKFEQQEKQNHE